MQGLKGLIKILLVVFTTLLFANVAASIDPVLTMFNVENVIPQEDSVRFKTLLNVFDSYEAKLKTNPKDSVEIFKNLGLISAELKKPSDALVYTEKYIDNSTDVEILNKDSYNQIIETPEYQVLKDKYLIKWNTLIFICFYIVFIGVFFAVIINLKKSADRASNLLIGGFVLVHSLFILEWSLYCSNIRYSYPHTYIMSSSIALFYAPLLYFYFRRITGEHKFKSQDLLHFLAPVILLSILMPFYALSGEEKLKVMFNLSDLYSKKNFFFIVFIPKISSYIIYGYFIGRLYFKNRKELSEDTRDDDLNKWKRNLYYIHIMYMVSYTFYGFSASGIIPAESDFIYHSQMLAMSFMVLYIAKMAYLKPQIFNYKNFIEFENEDVAPKYVKSGLTESLSTELKEELMRLFSEERIYKDSNLNLDLISEKLNTTRHNTSQIINEQFNMNFFELINKFRIEEALNLLQEDINGDLNIIDVAYEVGYNNKVTFNKAFKKETSLTPTQFIESLNYN
ncbi:AraC family transcriptional regulator [Flavobacteriaceae bacterium MAR_2010_72]|nr:AraC family transcriptional regulator [Flavobacteriaceae bacterium MAR_2010_72]TVZ58686.1 AraC-like DNA-binding protein [Flavobacteriaceae bacterium MAR_2010_105]